MDALLAVLNEAGQQLAVAHVRSAHAPDTMSECGLYDKLSQALQGLTMWVSTEPDRMRSYVAGAGAGRVPFDKSAMEFKVVQNLGKVSGDKAKFRQWNHKLASALSLVNDDYADIMDKVGRELDVGKPMDDVEDDAGKRRGFAKLNQDLYNIIIDKAEGEAYDRIKNLKAGDGLHAYMVLHKWFTDVSGMGLAEQARKLMHPDPPKDESGLSEAIETWTDKVKRLEAHGPSFKMGPVFKMNALKSLMVGKSKEYFELWETEKHVAYDETSMNDFFDEVLAKVKDYARRKKLDSAVKTKVQQGHDPMDIGQVDYWANDRDDNEVNVVGGKGRQCWTCGGTDHIAADCPNGKGKGGKSSAKGGYGPCARCGDFGHWARECPLPKGKGKGEYGNGEYSKGDYGKSGYGKSGYGKGGYGKKGHSKGEYGKIGYGNGDYGKGGWKGKGRQVNECDSYENRSYGHDYIADVNLGEGEVDQVGDADCEWVRVVKRGLGASGAHERGFNSVEKKATKTNKEIGEVSQDGCWERVRVQVDSGAFDWVTPKNTADGIPITETPSSRQGACYTAANGTDIKAYGEKVIKGVSDEGLGISVKMQVADVKRTLGSVMSMNRTGNKVVLDGEDSYILNKKTGKVMKIHVEGHQYVFYMWVKVGYRPQRVVQIGAVHGNRYEALAVDEEEDFSRQDALE